MEGELVYVFNSDVGRLMPLAFGFPDDEECDRYRQLDTDRRQAKREAEKADA